MTFLTDETGADTGNPIELFRFEGSIDTYCYTSGNRPFTYNTDLYKPVPMERSDIKLGDVTEKNELKVSFPTSVKLVKDYGFDIPPPELYLEIFRVHGTDGTIQPWFSGSVNAITMEGNKASVSIPSIFSAYMSSEFPNVMYQSQCNHPLYSTRCGVNRADFTLLGVIDSIIDETRIIVTSAADKPDQWLKAGEIVTNSERRLIVDHTGSILTLGYPFRSMTVGQDITAYAGCDHSIETCHAKFNNLVNFLGFPYTPSLNPFLKGLR